jgi:hypothetical protein
VVIGSLSGSQVRPQVRQFQTIPPATINGFTLREPHFPHFSPMYLLQCPHTRFMDSYQLPVVSCQC